MKQNNLEQVYKRLFEAFGAQNWWPGETQLEVIVGAVLTQNTAWQNVKRAIVNLKGAGVLSLNGLIDVGSDGLAELIRPSGYFNVKAKRLKAVVNFLSGSGGIKGLETAPTVELRRMLLDVNGVGEETADSILLYAFNRPVFVVDAYTKRVFSRLGFLDAKKSYSLVQSFFETRLPADVAMFNEFHALIVRLGKDFCKKTRPLCGKCPINEMCEFKDKA